MFSKNLNQQFSVSEYSFTLQQRVFFVIKETFIPEFLLSISITIENFNFVEKENKENFVKFFRKFADSKCVKTCD